MQVVLATLLLASACIDVSALRLSSENVVVDLPVFANTNQLANTTQRMISNEELSARFGRRIPPDGFLPDKNLPDDQYFSQLRKIILENCGQACEMTASKGKGLLFDIVEKKNQCKSLFSKNMQHLDCLTNRWPPTRQIPEAMRMDFLMGNESMYVHDEFHQENQGNKNSRHVWTEKLLSNLMGKYDRRDFKNAGYGKHDTAVIHDLIMKHKAELENKHCAVLGSQSPWLEAILLHAGVGRVTTIEYADIDSSHPQIKAMHPSDWAEWYKATPTSDHFDCIASYSSLEHAGLGRYGDIVNPWGDLIAMGKLSCSAKKGALMFIGYPSGHEDEIGWNGCRYYGPKRWAQMLANTEQISHTLVSAIHHHQGMVVARKL